MLFKKHLLLVVFKIVEYICSRFDEQKNQHLCEINFKQYTIHIYIYIYIYIYIIIIIIYFFFGGGG